MFLIETFTVAFPFESTDCTFIETVAFTCIRNGALWPAIDIEPSMPMDIRYVRSPPCWKPRASALPPPPFGRTNTTPTAISNTMTPTATPIFAKRLPGSVRVLRPPTNVQDSAGEGTGGGPAGPPGGAPAGG